MPAAWALLAAASLASHLVGFPSALTACEHWPGKPFILDMLKTTCILSISFCIRHPVFLYPIIASLRGLFGPRAGELGCQGPSPQGIDDKTLSKPFSSTMHTPNSPTLGHHLRAEGGRREAGASVRCGQATSPITLLMCPVIPHS